MQVGRFILVRDATVRPQGPLQQVLRNRLTRIIYFSKTTEVEHGGSRLPGEFLVTKERLGQVQLRIMQLLWKLERATARELTDELNKSEQIAHSTVQTLLRQLEAKGSVAHEQEGRTFYFYPLVKEDRVKQSAARALIENVFGGNASGLVSYLLETERISTEELSHIRQQIDQKKKNKQ